MSSSFTFTLPNEIVLTDTFTLPNEIVLIDANIIDFASVNEIKLATASNTIDLVSLNEIRLAALENFEFNRQSTILGGSDIRKRVGGRDTAKKVGGSGGLN